MFRPLHLVRLLSALTMLLAVSLVAGCGNKSATTDQTTTTTTDNVTTEPASVPTDAQIAAIVLAANDEEIDLGDYAKSKASNEQVKTFAKQMATDHAAVNKNAKDLASKLDLKPEENATSESLKADAKSTKEMLEKLEGPAFDKAYVDHEVTYHENLLSAIDNTLLPNAQNAELKQLLTDTRPAVVAHLDHAKKLQAQLGSS
jgi:putative membrane protein